MVLRKEASRKNSSGKAGWNRGTALKYQIFSVGSGSPLKPIDYREQLSQEFGAEHEATAGAPPQQQPTNNLLEYAESRINSLSAQIIEKTNELERLREYTVQLEEGEKSLIQELTQQLAIKDQEISRIAVLCAKKEAENRKLSASFEANINSQREYAERIKSILVKKEGETAMLIEGLQRELGKKDAEVASLRNALFEKRQSNELSPPSESLHSEQMQFLQQEIESKNRELKRLEKTLFDEQKLNKPVQARLKEQMAEMASQIEGLKSFIIEKEKFVQSLESAFEKRIAAKEEELRHLRGVIHAKPETKLHKQVDELKSELHIKEETAKLMAEEVAKVKEQSALLRKRLEERQRIFFESEKAYEELIAKLREQHEARLKAIVQESSQKEAALKTAIEEERAKLQRETVLMREKEKQVEETLQAFASTSQKLIRLGEAATLGEPEAGIALAEVKEKERQIEEKEKQLEEERRQIEERRKYAHNKEAELKKLLAETEARIAELKSKEAALAGKEAAVDRKEQLLLKEQEALIKELDVLTNAGIEISRSKQYIRQKLEQIGNSGQPAQQQPTQQAWQPRQPLQPPVESLEIAGGQQEQPFLPQAKQQQRQQPSMQEMGFGAGAGVEEAQEEEGIDVPRFTGLTPETAVKETPLEAVEEGEALTSAATAMKTVTTPKLKAAKIKTAKLPKPLTKKTKKHPKIVAGKLKKKAGQQQKKLQQQRKAERIIPTTAAIKEPSKGLPQDLSAKPDQELFTEMGGYSELEEIKSIVEVGLQHGDSIEQIRQSLITSGYSRQNIGKVLSSIQKK